MTIKNKLQAIVRLSGLTQEKLAAALGVSFPTLNSWINGRSRPRQKAEERIEAMYLHQTGRNVIPPEQLDRKKKEVLARQKALPPVFDLLKDRPDLYDQFLLSFTYNTNRLEGSTLTEPETAAILFNNEVLPDKTLVEQMEAKNHQAAFHYMVRHAGEARALGEVFILKLHSILMNGIADDAGSYRSHGVRIVGSSVPTANYLKVPLLMKELAGGLNRTHKDPVGYATQVHAQFERIHPFSDGNGRVGRLLLGAMLLKAGLAPGIVEQQKKRFYLMYLEQAQTDEDYSRLEDFILDGILTGYAILDTADI